MMNAARQAPATGVAWQVALQTLANDASSAYGQLTYEIMDFCI